MAATELYPAKFGSGLARQDATDGTPAPMPQSRPARLPGVATAVTRTAPTLRAPEVRDYPLNWCRVGDLERGDDADPDVRS